MKLFNYKGNFMQGIPIAGTVTIRLERYSTLAIYISIVHIMFYATTNIFVVTVIILLYIYSSVCVSE